MQTFLPYKDFYETAASLDYRRLGKQRVECMQIYNALVGNTKAWVSHPATQMWNGYEEALLYYMSVITDEWIERGYKNNIVFHYKYLLDNNLFLFDDNGEFIKFVGELPWWLGWEDFHNSHKSKLLQKDKEFYSKFNWDVPLDLEYVWPNDKIKNQERRFRGS